MPEQNGLVEALWDLYEHERFRIALVVFDTMTVAVFVALTFVRPSPWAVALDAVIGTLMLIELAMRTVIAHNRFAFLRRPSSLLDMVIIVSLFILRP